MSAATHHPRHAAGFGAGGSGVVRPVSLSRRPASVPAGIGAANGPFKRAIAAI
jgi:hypothetical protein